MSSSNESSFRRRALQRMYDFSSTISDNHEGKNRGLAAEAAASIFGREIDRLNGRPSSSEDLDEDEELISSTGELARTGHFVDSLLEKLLKHAIAEDDPERLLLHQKFKDPERSKRPNLSFKILVSNFRTLSGRMSGLFAVQYGIIRIVTWKRPSKTISLLVLYTWLCLWPHLILAYPLIFLIFGVMIPGYLHRHPTRTPPLIKVKKRGQSLLDFFNQSEDRSIVSDLMDDPIEDRVELAAKAESQLLTSSAAETTAESTSIIDPDVTAETEQEEDSSSSTTTSDRRGNRESKSHFKSQITLMMNMRDLQNLTTDIIEGYDAAEVFWYQKAGFKDENLSTLIFYGVIIATGIVLFFGPYIPWRIIFIQSGWAGLILCHPNSKKYIQQIQFFPSNVKRKARVKKEVEKYERQDIIVDDSAEVRKVEIFELQVKSLTTNSWKFYIFSNDMFDLKHPNRAAGKRPSGVHHLSKIIPPKDWKFDIGYVNEWVTDLKPREFIHERSIENNTIKVRDNETEGWIYDSAPDLDISFEFRRRRLYRECFRYSRPAKEPSRL